MAKHDAERDDVTGTLTTGHEWDGIKELDTPLPRWWVIVFYATILWAIGYYVVYPSWPTLSSYSKGIWETTNRTEIKADLAQLAEERKFWTDQIEALEITEVVENPELRNWAYAGGQAVFAINCVQCHGSAGSGATNFPILADDDWLWGGTLEEIEYTLNYGIRSGHGDEHFNIMPNFIEDEILTQAEVDEVTRFVLSLSSGSPAAGEGAVIFEEQCAACHGEEGEGQAFLGGPRLNDAIWLFGDGSFESVAQQIGYPQHGVMPYWEGKLSDVEIKSVSIYVHSLGGGQ